MTSNFFNHTIKCLSKLGISITYDRAVELLEAKLKATANTKHWLPTLLQVETLSDETTIPLSLIKRLIPWRMGPHTLGDFSIDGEWRSDLQWEYISKNLPNLTNPKITDVGCSSGFATFKLASHYDNSLVFGFDPIERCWLQGELLRKANKIQNAAFLPFGVEEACLFPNAFDLVLCSGVLHHERDPLSSIINLKSMIKLNGFLHLECMCIPGDEDKALVPESRYAKMRNAWIIPTRERVRTWLASAGFKNITFLYEYKITEEMQRKTEFAPYESLAEFLDPLDSNKTLEGHPAPWKVAFLAVNPVG